MLYCLYHLLLRCDYPKMSYSSKSYGKGHDCRKQQAEEAELRRLAVEEEMEARRKVLMSENGYWSKRMAQDAQTKALQEESIVHPGGTQVTLPTTYFPLLPPLVNA